jgi:hypothetical protein
MCIYIYVYISFLLMDETLLFVIIEVIEIIDSS